MMNGIFWTERHLESFDYAWHHRWHLILQKVKTTEDLMKTLATLYEKPFATNKVFLMKRLFNMKMVEGGSIADHLNEFNKLLRVIYILWVSIL